MRSSNPARARSSYGLRGPFRRLLASRDGAAAIEFALLAIPFFLIVFAIIETFVAFTGEQLLENAVDTMGRKLRTGQIVGQTGHAGTFMNAEQFRTAFCEEIDIMMSCNGSSTAPKLLLDVRSFDSFADMPTGVPRQGGKTYGPLDTSSFAYAPAGPGAKTMVRAYYRWPITADLIRPYLSNVRQSAGASSSYFLMVATAAFTNENYP
ncbi:TadE/TadG family type IV pilus assembly protein [Pararhizobium mangrovi]|uniref:Pilus assembly protein n=1 Tax=Pararhizobium mangrovi TaxID=2590452 RepID=A0A506UH88_9HYPH|nr:TadE/TadG family type IV pilus assembly protein [Pararhizobium mangrovi]TPW32667.1 pilus assembly protein [Pararhizobium mangrovi]